MDTLKEIRDALMSDMNVDSTSTLYPEATLNSAINRAYRKAGALFPWADLQDAKKTSTVSGQEYYDYPTNWRSKSIWRIEVDGEKYGEDPDGSPLSFDDYLVWREDNPSATDKKWATQQRRYFINPVPTANGTNNLHVWGIMVTETLSEDGDITIFSYSTPEGNEAVLLEAKAILKSKGDDLKTTDFKSKEAKELLAIAWGKERDEDAKYEKNQPMWEVNDMFGAGSSKDLRGRFDI